MASQASPEPVVTRTASCLCKSIEISITGQDKGAVVCHCNNCKASSGSAFMHNNRFMESEITVTKGQDVVKTYADSDTGSGATLYRHFCGNCGSPMWLTGDRVKGMTIAICGTLQGERAQPQTELWVERKYDWIGDLAAKKP